MGFNPDLLDNVIPPPGTQYKSSNKFHKGFSLLGLFTGIAIAILIGLLYGLISKVNPIVYINFLLLFFAVFGIVFTGMLSKWIGKSRNLAVDMFTAFSIGLFGWYSSWAYFYTHQTSVGFFEALLQPGQVMEYALNYSTLHRVSIGRFSSGMPMPGEVMFLFYVIELIAFLFPVYLARKTQLTSYFCEGCNTSNTTLTYYGKRTKGYEDAYQELLKGDVRYFSQARLEKKLETLWQKQLFSSHEKEKTYADSGDYASLNALEDLKKAKKQSRNEPIAIYRLEFSNCKKCKNNPIVDIYNGIIKLNRKDVVEFTGESDLIRATYIDEKGIEAILKGMRSIESNAE